jgi:hypothetical protein
MALRVGLELLNSPVVRDMLVILPGAHLRRRWWAVLGILSVQIMACRVHDAVSALPCCAERQAALAGRWRAFLKPDQSCSCRVVSL